MAQLGTYREMLTKASLVEMVNIACLIEKTGLTGVPSYSGTSAGRYMEIYRNQIDPAMKSFKRQNFNYSPNALLNNFTSEICEETLDRGSYTMKGGGFHYYGPERIMPLVRSVVIPPDNALGFGKYELYPQVFIEVGTTVRTGFRFGQDLKEDSWINRVNEALDSMRSEFEDEGFVFERNRPAPGRTILFRTHTNLREESPSEIVVALKLLLRFFRVSAL